MADDRDLIHDDLAAIASELSHIRQILHAIALLQRGKAGDEVAAGMHLLAVHQQAP